MLRPFSANAHLLSALDVEQDEVVNTAFGQNLALAGRHQEKIRPSQFLPGEPKLQATRNATRR